MKDNVSQFVADTMAATPKLKTYLNDENEYQPNPEVPLDSLNICLLQVKASVESMVGEIEEQSNQIQHNILDNLCVYEEHYMNLNEDLLIRA